MQRGNWLKVYVIDVLPIITIALYVLGVIYSIAYYSVYGINIIPYLTPGDMLMAIIEPLVLVLLFSLLYCSFIYFPYFLFNLFEIGSKQNVKKNVAKAKEKDKSDPVQGKMNLFVLVVIILFFSFLLYWILSQFAIFTEKGMLLAVTALFFPFLIIVFSNIIKSVSKRQITISLLVYYLYCIAIFYYSGLNCAIYNKKIDDVKFDIETTQGVVYKDNNYGYIDQLDNSIFLYEKKTDKIIMLYTNNIMSTKIDFGSRKRGLISSVIEGDDERW